MLSGSCLDVVARALFALAVRDFTPPVLFMSGYIDNALVEGELERYPDRLLRKPFTTSELRARVRQILDQRGAGVQPV